ncbi:MAG: nitrite reductase small subunit NirD [Pseudolysinimonas sp.]
MTGLLIVTDVCALDELEPLWGEAALVDGQQIALFLLPDGSLYAVSNRDPATGSFVMSRGIVGSRGERHTIASPLHKEVYDLESGECFTTPGLHLPTFGVSAVEGRVLVATDPRVTGVYRAPISASIGS